MKRKFTKPIDLKDFNRTSSWRKDVAKDQQRIAKKMFSNTKKIYIGLLIACIVVWPGNLTRGRLIPQSSWPMQRGGLDS